MTFSDFGVYSRIAKILSDPGVINPTCIKVSVYY